VIQDPERGKLLRPAILRPADRHVLLGVSHASNDPARHRTFQIRATYDAARKGWQADVGEQNLNDQRGNWTRLLGQTAPVFATAAACLGHATTTIVAAFDESDCPE
jgi:hypothetical protein